MKTLVPLGLKQQVRLGIKEHIERIVKSLTVTTDQKLSEAGLAELNSHWENLWSHFNVFASDIRRDPDAAEYNLLSNALDGLTSSLQKSIATYHQNPESIKNSDQFIRFTTDIFTATWHIFHYLSEDSSFSRSLKDKLRYSAPAFTSESFFLFLLNKLQNPVTDLAVENKLAAGVKNGTTQVLNQADGPESAAPETNSVWPPRNLTPGGQLENTRRKSPVPAAPVATMTDADTPEEEKTGKFTLSEIMSGASKEDLAKFNKGVNGNGNGNGNGGPKSRTPESVIVSIVSDLDQNAARLAAAEQAARDADEVRNKPASVLPRPPISNPVYVVYPVTASHAGSPTAAAPLSPRSPSTPALSTPELNQNPPSSVRPPAPVPPKNPSINPAAYLSRNIFDTLSERGGELVSRFRTYWRPKALAFQSAVNNFQLSQFLFFKATKKATDTPAPKITEKKESPYRIAAKVIQDRATTASKKVRQFPSTFLNNHPRLRRNVGITLASLAGAGAITAVYGLANHTSRPDSREASANIDPNPTASPAATAQPAKQEAPEAQTAPEENQSAANVNYKVDTFNPEFAKYIDRLGPADGVIRMLRFVSSQVSVPEITDPAKQAELKSQGKLFLTGKESEEDQRIIILLAFLKQAAAENYQNQAIQNFISIHQRNLLKFQETRVWQKGAWTETKLLLAAFQKPLRLATPKDIIGFAPDSNPETNPAVVGMKTAPTFYAYFQKAAQEMQKHPTAKSADPQTIGVETCKKLRTLFDQVRDKTARGGLKSMHRAWCGENNEKLTQQNAFSRSLRQATAVYSDGRVINFAQLAKDLRDRINSTLPDSKKTGPVQTAVDVQ